MFLDPQPGFDSGTLIPAKRFNDFFPVMEAILLDIVVSSPLENPIVMASIFPSGITKKAVGTFVSLYCLDTA